MNRTLTTDPSAGRRRAAAVIDLENVLIESNGSHHGDCASATLGSLSTLTAGVPSRTAMGPRLLGSHMRDVSATSWGLTLTTSAPNAADRALLQQAAAWVDAGVTDLIVVSGDHAFAELASQARLHVVSHAAKLSRTLRLAAFSVTLLSTPSCNCLDTTTVAGQVAA